MNDARRRIDIRMIGVLALLFGSGLLVPPHVRGSDPAVLEAQQRRIEVIQKVAPSVVAVFGSAGNGGGSGVLISPDGYALSNFHVTSSAGNFMKCGLNDGVLYDAVIVGIDPTGDVALLKLLGRDDFPYAAMGDSDAVRVGDWAYAMGNPFLLATDFQPTVTYGIVSGVHRYQYPAGTILEYTDCIQVDSSINPGNSGGPLFNDDGELIGINGRGSFEKRGRVNSGAGYAISINQIKNFMDHLRSGRVVDHGTLGAVVSSNADGSVTVTQLLEESEPYRRGLRLGDEILEFGGRPIQTANEFKNVLGIFPKGWTIPLVYRNAEGKHEIYVRLRGLHRKSELMLEPEQPRPGRRRNPGEEPGDDDQDDKEESPEGEKESQKGEDGDESDSAKAHAAPGIPEEYAHMYVAKPGFVNAYFNRIELDRTLSGLKELGNYSTAAGVWDVSGATADGAPFAFKLADKGLGLEWKGQPYYQGLEGADPVDEPPGTGGLLMAMHHLRLFLARGEKGFTEFYYLGSEPLDGRGERVDVVVSVLTGVETHWYFSREQGGLVGFNTWLNENVDACAIRFGEFRPFDGRKFPAAFTVLHADKPIAEFRIDQITFGGDSTTDRQDGAKENQNEKAE